MKNWKKWSLLAMTGAAMLGVASTSAEAYALSSEVSAPTAALVSATQIGVLSYDNPDLKNLMNKDAIVVMAFGTTYPDTRAKTITATVDAIKKANPNVRVVTAFSSHIVIKRIKENEGIKMPTPEEALDQLKAEGYTRIALVSLDVIPGIEYDYKTAVFNNRKKDFKKMTLGTPLLYWQGQEDEPDDVDMFVVALGQQLPKQKKGDAILLMAHGTPHISNAYYSVIQAKLAESGYDNVFVYTVEGWPSLETVLPKLKAANIKHVTLMPIMMVAGDHANNDMAGDEKDSHKSILEAEGYKVDTYLHGLGENQTIRDMYAAKAKEAVKALTNK